MATYTTADARQAFSDVINRAAYGKERVVLSRRGRDVVAVIPVEDLELLEAVEDREDAAAIRRAWAKQGDKPLADLDAVKERLGFTMQAKRSARPKRKKK